QRAAKLIPSEFWNALARGIIEKVPGVQIAVTKKFERVSMQRVGSRRSHDGDLAAGRFPVLGAIGVLDDVKFPHRVYVDQGPADRSRQSGAAGAAVTGILHTINDVHGLVRPPARDRVGMARGATGGLGRAEIAGAYVERQQLIETAAIQRQVLDLLLC